MNENLEVMEEVEEENKEGEEMGSDEDLDELFGEVIMHDHEEQQLKQDYLANSFQ